MREIKFRAWDEQNKVMEYKVNVNDGKPVKYGYQWFNHGNTIHDSELMQYTGLKDKNGKEIYEGDLIKVDDEHLYIICFRVQDSGYIGSNEYGYDEQDLCYLACNYEVIGNIYENPELLK